MIDFDKDFYLATLRTARNIGIPVIPKFRAAQIMAIVFVFGNNEGFTLSPKFQCDRIYIQETYNIEGGKTPTDESFNDMLREYIEKYEGVKNDADPVFKDAKQLIMQRYAFPLYC